LGSEKCEVVEEGPSINTFSPTNTSQLGFKSFLPLPTPQNLTPEPPVTMGTIGGTTSMATPAATTAPTQKKYIKKPEPLEDARDWEKFK
jgi:hypothetical protein